MKTRRLRTRLMLTYTALIVIGFGALAWLAGGQIARGAQEDLAYSLQTHAALLARSLKEEIEHLDEGETSIEQIGQRAGVLAAQVDAQVTLLDDRGRVWYGSDDTGDDREFQRGPEVMSALAGTISSDVRANRRGTASVYAAAPVVDDHQVLAVVLLARPASAADAAVRQRWLTLGSAVILLGLLSVAASIWLAASLTRPLEQLRTAALRLAAGDFSQRVAQSRQDELGQVAAAFNHMADQVQAMLDEQRAFAANASHELRTPLTTIRLRSEALRHNHLSSKLARQYVVEIDDEVARLGGLVEDLIWLSRLDAGRAERGDETVDVVRLARSVLHDLAAREAAQGRRLTLETAGDIPEVQASTHHLRVVLRNLLTNAIHYTPAGGAVVCRIQATEDTLLITIADTGHGIAAQDLPHVFERFYRSDKGRGRSTAGVGLGLPLVQSIVQFYGGHVTLESAGLDQGTTARVWWPIPCRESCLPIAASDQAGKTPSVRK